jgi:hypothetical protein
MWLKMSLDSLDLEGCSEGRKNGALVHNFILISFIVSRHHQTTKKLVKELKDQKHLIHFFLSINVS